MADQNTTELTELTNPASTDLLYAVGDPGGTPVDRKITLANVNTFSMIAGENIAAIGTSLYVKASDGKVWKSSTSADESTYSFIGFSASTASAEGSIAISPPGTVATNVASGTIGQSAYLNDTAGTVSNTPDSTRYAEVGKYITTTSILVKNPRFIRSSKQDITNTTAQTQTCGFRPAKIMITVSPYTAGVGGASIAMYPNENGSEGTHMALGTEDSYGIFYFADWHIVDTSGGSPGTTVAEGVIKNLTATGFDLHASTATTAVTVVWMAEN